MTERQQVVRKSITDVDVELAAFIADVVELAGSFRRLADGIAGEVGLTQTLWFGLSVFSAEPITVAQAARRLGSSRQAVQRTANELLARELAVTEQNPDHRASPFIVLTEDGRAALERLAAVSGRSRPGWFADTDIDGLRAAHPEIRRLRDVLRGAKWTDARLRP